MAYFTPPLFQPLVDLQFVKDGVSPEYEFLALLRLFFDFGQQAFSPFLRLVRLVRPQL